MKRPAARRRAAARSSGRRARPAPPARRAGTPRGYLMLAVEAVAHRRARAAPRGCCGGRARAGRARRAPSIQPTMRPCAELVGHALEQSRRRPARSTASPSSARNCAQLAGVRPPVPRRDDRARRGADCRSGCGRRRAPRRARSPRRPARGARRGARSRTRAGCARWRTPFSATPPPRQRSRGRVSACSAARDVDQDVLEHPLHAGGDVGVAPPVRRRAGRSDRTRSRGGPNSSTNLRE